MKDEVYVVDLLVSHQTAKVERAQCKCVAAVKVCIILYAVHVFFTSFCSLSASCVHVSAVLHYLIGLKGHQFMSPSQHETSDEDDQQPLPVTSFPMSVETTKKEKRIKSPYWRSAIRETPVWSSEEEVRFF